MLYSLLHNVTLIISYVFVAVKVKEYLIKSDKVNEDKLMWYAPVLAGVLSFLVMLEPFQYQGMNFDLRSVPILIFSFVGGLKWGIVSAIFPAIYRYTLGGPVWQAIIFGIILPVLIGSLMRDSKEYTKTCFIINLKKVLMSFAVFTGIKFVFAYLTISIPFTFWLKYNLIQGVLSAISIAIIVLIFNDSHKILLMQKDLVYKSFHDSMLNLPNRRYFQDFIERALSKKRSGAIAMLDIDRFKHYNDSLGHSAGDEVIKKVAEVIKESVRIGDDFAARYGGEEFIIYLNSNDNDVVETILERIRTGIENYSFKGKEVMPLGKVTISIGASFIDEQKTIEETINEADKALYTSKENGRNQISFYWKI